MKVVIENVNTERTAVSSTAWLDLRTRLRLRRAESAGAPIPRDCESKLISNEEASTAAKNVYRRARNGDGLPEEKTHDQDQHRDQRTITDRHLQKSRIVNVLVSPRSEKQKRLPPPILVRKRIHNGFQMRHRSNENKISYR